MCEGRGMFSSHYHGAPAENAGFLGNSLKCPHGLSTDENHNETGLLDVKKMAHFLHGLATTAEKRFSRLSNDHQYNRLCNYICHSQAKNKSNLLLG